MTLSVPSTHWQGEKEDSSITRDFDDRLSQITCFKRLMRSVTCSYFVFWLN